MTARPFVPAAVQPEHKPPGHFWNIWFSAFLISSGTPVRRDPFWRREADLPGRFHEEKREDDMPWA